MEFPNIGERCSWSLCQTLDFLPFTCSFCNKIFCKHHFDKDSHDCKSFIKELNKQTDKKSFTCSITDCITSSPIEMLCAKCSKNFCLTHRYHDCFDTVFDIEKKKKLWNQPKEEFSQSIKVVNCDIDEKIKKAVQNPKKQATALKIQLMRLKGKAEGSSSIPTTDRVYFLIILPKGSFISSKPIFVSKNWSVGKVIDIASEICKVTNKNIELNSPKLRLFKASNGIQISKETSVKIVDLINNNEISNGETLILEYIQSSEDINNFVLEDLSQYSNLL